MRNYHHPGYYREAFIGSLIAAAGAVAVWFMWNFPIGILFHPIP